MREGVAAILQGIGAAPSMRAAAYLVYAGDYLQKPEEVVAKAFGESYAGLVSHTRRLVQIQRAAREAQVGHGHDAGQQALQTERVRKMLLAFSRDLRVVLLRLASRLQTLRWYAATKRACPRALAEESMQVFAPLANRLGIWQIKWEIEDLSFRFLEPEAYRQVAQLLDEKRVEREQGVEAFRIELGAELAAAGLKAEVQGRPKHLYSIWKKMRGKGLDFARVFDIRAMRVIVADVPTCYAVLGRVHERYQVVPGEFDDYIAKPKPNGYQSLHTVVLDAEGRAVEVQIRTRAMHEHAEHGVAAHWAYKEAGAKGYAGVSAGGDFDAQIAEARKAVLRQLLAWEREFRRTGRAGRRGRVRRPHLRLHATGGGGGAARGRHADRLRLRAAHRPGPPLPRCQGRRRDGAAEHAAEERADRRGDGAQGGRPVARLAQRRARLPAEPAQQGQGARLVQRAGDARHHRTWPRGGREAAAARRPHGDEARRPGNAAGLPQCRCAVRGGRQGRVLAAQYREPAAPGRAGAQRGRGDRRAARARAGARAAGRRAGGVGVESLLTSLARCCRPAPPDGIGGYVTRGKGVAIHRADCSNFRQMAARSPERVIAVAWGEPRGDRAAVYPVDVVVEAGDRQGLLRDISEVFAKEKMNVTGVKTQTIKDARGGTAWMTFTVEVGDASRLAHVLGLVSRVPGVRAARRK